MLNDREFVYTKKVCESLNVYPILSDDPCQRSVFVGAGLLAQMCADLVDFLFELVNVVVLCVYHRVPP